MAHHGSPLLLPLDQPTMAFRRVVGGVGLLLGFLGLVFIVERTQIHSHRVELEQWGPLGERQRSVYTALQQQQLGGGRQAQQQSLESKGKAEESGFTDFLENWATTHPGANINEEEGLYAAWKSGWKAEKKKTQEADESDAIQGALPPDHSKEGAANIIDAQFAGEPEPPSRAWGSMTPDTIIASPEGPPDFNGQDAIIARHPDLGAAPTTLHEHKAETRGSFTIRMTRNGMDEDGDVALAIWGPNWPYKCTIRGYRKLSDDFRGNDVFTGYKKSWSGERRIDTGYISPGVRGEYDVVTCRDDQTGEVQYFRFGYGGSGNNDMTADPPPDVLGPHFGMNSDAVDFDMDRPTFEDERASQDWYGDYDPNADIKPLT